MKHGRPSLTPRLKPLSPRKSAVLSVLDVGPTAPALKLPDRITAVSLSITMYLAWA